MLEAINGHIQTQKIRGAIHRLMFAPSSIYPLITFRILFGLLMCLGTARFMYNGWVEKLFIRPQHYFKFYGFEWVETLGTNGVYILHWVILVSAFFVAIGFLYRLSIISFFLSFTYVELMDATNYLNHYYLVILLAFLMICLPANAFFSVDVRLFPKIKRTQVPAWCIHIIMSQLCIVYFFAGLAKLNSDWLFRAMPLSIWLPEHKDFTILGYFFQFQWVAKIFSWFGAFYDLTIWIFLLMKRTRPIAYLFVIIFHVLTWMLFNIGLFPFIMILSTLIFFSGDWHARFYTFWNKKDDSTPFSAPRKWAIYPIALYCLIQVLMPLRSHLYPGNVLWHEQGYRFAWRVMLVEKPSYAQFYLWDKDTGDKVEIQNARYLTTFQEKQMAIQSDFILQYARIIANDYKGKHNIQHPKVTADIYVALNRRTSSRFINPSVDLLELKDSFANKEWVLHCKE